MAANPTEQVKVIIHDDKTKVEMILLPGFGNQPTAKQHCHAKLQELDVEITEAVVKAVDQLIAQSKKISPTPGTQPVRGVVALAQLPADGLDGGVEWLLDNIDKPKEQPPEDLTEEQKRNYYEDSAYTTVKKGTVVGILHEPTIGNDGRDIHGNTIHAKDGKAYDLQFDETIMQEASGKLVTQAEGVLVKSNYSICVRKEIVVNGAIDFSTGNIDFTGDVIVHEGIKDCFTVKTKGNVTVEGLIEAAHLITGKNLTANGGMAGREQGSVKIGNDLIAKYLDGVIGSVDHDLKVEREIINCQLTVLNDLDAKTGLVIGGNVIVGGKVLIDTVGSPANVRSDLTIGSVPNLDPIIVSLQTFIDSIADHHKKLIEEQEQIAKYSCKLTADQKERVTELTFELMTIDTPLNKAKDALFRVTSRAEDLRTVDVMIRKMLFTNTVLHVMGTSHKVRNDLKGPVKIFKDDGRIYSK